MEPGFPIGTWHGSGRRSTVLLRFVKARYLTTCSQPHLLRIYTRHDNTSSACLCRMGHHNSRSYLRPMATKNTGSTRMPPDIKAQLVRWHNPSGSNIDASDVGFWRYDHDWTHVLYTRRDGLGDPYRGRTIAIPYSNLHHPIWHNFLSCIRSAYV